jgi:hypothetical protein
VRALMSAPNDVEQGHDFFPAEPESARNNVIAALAGGAVALTRSKSIESAVPGSEWQCTQTAFVFTTCALRAERQAPPALETTNKVAVQ